MTNTAAPRPAAEVLAEIETLQTSEELRVMVQRELLLHVEQVIAEIASAGSELPDRLTAIVRVVHEAEAYWDDSINSETGPYTDEDYTAAGRRMYTETLEQLPRLLASALTREQRFHAWLDVAPLIYGPSDDDGS